MACSTLARLIVAATAVFTLFASVPSFAQTPYPSRPLRIIVANTPGSLVDLLARRIGGALAPKLGQPVVIVNQPGAGGLIGQQSMAAAPKDGYTLGLYGNTAVIAPHLSKNLSFDPIKDITTVAIFADATFVAVVPQNSPHRDLESVIQAAKRAPGKLTFGSPGTGTALHMAGMQFQSMAGIDMLHVPYKGASPLAIAAISGEIDVAFLTIGAVASQIRQGKIRALGVTGRQRSPLMPEVPMIAETAVPGYEYESWVAIVAPAGVPAEIVKRLNDEIRDVVGTAEMREYFLQSALVPGVLSPDESQRVVNADYQRMGELLRRSGVSKNDS